MDDRSYMRRALELARRGMGRTAPNPMVGAVIVRDGRIIGEGWHARCGELHAERHALSRCTESAEGATIYVTLEPCCHQGRQPPCTEAVIQAGIRRVVVGSPDPNPLVAGKGLDLLRQHGITVETDVLRDECDALNTVFFHYITTGTPYVVLKYAMTMDGKIACHTGLSRWVTGPEARRRVHEDRNRYTAIMVGVGTVLQDDPQLTCRIEGGRDPIRIICDSRLRTPTHAEVVRTAKTTPTILATCCEDSTRHAPYLEAGCKVLMSAADPEGRLDLPALMKRLAANEIDSVFLEGGSTLNWSALRSGIVQRVQTYLAPKLFGGTEAPSPIGGTGADSPDGAYLLSPPEITRLGNDILLESEVLPCVHGDR